LKPKNANTKNIIIQVVQLILLKKLSPLEVEVVEEEPNRLLDVDALFAVNEEPIGESNELFEGKLFEGKLFEGKLFEGELYVLFIIIKINILNFYYNSHI
jgi:hypothetical protein